MTINTNSETKAYLVNRDFLINRLNLQSKNEKSILFEKSDLLVLSPSIQNNRYSFDLQKNTVEVARNSNKKGLLIIRFFQDYLVLSLKKVFSDLLVGETIHTYEDGRQKWSMNVRKKEEDYYVSIYGDTRELKTTKYTGVDLELYVNRLLADDDEEEFHEEVLLQQIPSSDLITHIHNYITSKGFNYTEANIKNLYLSLRSKPFVIISGISGTGKTKIVQLFAESIGATEDNGQFTLIPVRPDWSDSSDLLGYKDIKEEFQKGPLTKVIERAHQNPELPYFVLLDEMNLARVEYYFSDVLSVMETRREEDGKIVSSQLISYKNQQKETVSVTLPNNLYVIGTVNMDETTHPFSKKVLDRANTIEFNEINFETNDFVEGEVNPIKIGNEQFEATYLFLKQAYPGNEDLVKQVSAELTEINEILQTIHAQVGYRVRDEICYYMIHNKNWDLMDYKVALDFCIMQKILPRISGSSDHVEKMLKSLYLRYAGKEYVKDAVVDKTASLTERKLVEMIRRLVRDGFTSFWGA